MTDAPTPRDVIRGLVRQDIDLFDEADWWADHILFALHAAGFAIVPREPTRAMHDAGNRIWGESVTAIYRAMVAAATQENPDES